MSATASSPAKDAFFPSNDAVTSPAPPNRTPIVLPKSDSDEQAEKSAPTPPNPPPKPDSDEQAGKSAPAPPNPPPKSDSDEQAGKSAPAPPNPPPIILQKPDSDEQAEKSAPDEQEEGDENRGGEEEEEQGECGFCLFMKGGGCKDSFIAWEQCIEEAEKNKEDIVNKCYQATALLKKCMEAHSDYYEPVLRAEKAAEEQAMKEIEEEASLAASEASAATAAPAPVPPPAPAPAQNEGKV